MPHSQVLLWNNSSYDFLSTFLQTLQKPLHKNITFTKISDLLQIWSFSTLYVIRKYLFITYTLGNTSSLSHFRKCISVIILLDHCLYQHTGIQRMYKQSRLLARENAHLHRGFIIFLFVFFFYKYLDANYEICSITIYKTQHL